MQPVPHSPRHQSSCWSPPLAPSRAHILPAGYLCTAFPGGTTKMRPRQHVGPQAVSPSYSLGPGLDRKHLQTSGHFLRGSHSCLLCSLTCTCQAMTRYVPGSIQVPMSPWELGEWVADIVTPPALCFLPQAGSAGHAEPYRKDRIDTV